MTLTRERNGLFVVQHSANLNPLLSIRAKWLSGLTR